MNLLSIHNLWFLPIDPMGHYEKTLPPGNTYNKWINPILARLIVTVHKKIVTRYHAPQTKCSIQLSRVSQPRERVKPGKLKLSSRCLGELELPSRFPHLLQQQLSPLIAHSIRLSNKMTNVKRMNAWHDTEPFWVALIQCWCWWWRPLCHDAAALSLTLNICRTSECYYIHYVAIMH